MSARSGDRAGLAVASRARLGPGVLGPALVVVAIASFAAGRTTSERPAPVAHETTRNVVAVPALDQAALERAVRDAVRSELAVRGEPVAPQAHEVPAPPTVTTKTAETIAAADQGHRIVAAAVAARRWTRADAAALRASLGAMDTEDRQVVLAQLVPAVNRDEVKVELDGRLF
jgi:hypothetical protein